MSFVFILNLFSKEYLQRQLSAVSCPFSGNLSTILEINIRGSLPLRKSKSSKGTVVNRELPLFALRVPRNYEFNSFKNSFKKSLNKFSTTTLSQREPGNSGIHVVLFFLLSIKLHWVFFFTTELFIKKEPLKFFWSIS